MKVDFKIGEPNLIVRGIELIAIYKNVDGRKILVGLTSEKGLADSQCKSLNEGYNQANAEIQGILC